MRVVASESAAPGVHMTTLQLAPSARPSVIIVGAGWAGMGAADLLSRANVSFLVLEASNRTGGRVHPLEFGDPSIWRGIVERGANWISGVAPPGVTKGGAGGNAKGYENVPYENPLYALARESRLAMARIAGSADGNMSAYDAVFTSTGDMNGDAGGVIRSAADAALDCVNQTWARHVSINTTMRAGLRKCGWRPRTEEQLAVDWAMSGEDANGAPARVESLKSFAPDSSYVWWGPDDYFVTDQNPRGFAALIDTLTRDSVPPGDKRVVFGAEVSRIDYGDCRGGGVQVQTKDGRVFKAEHEVISTLPLGVMRHSHESIFAPPLPAAQAALYSPRSRFVMGNLTHVVVQFPHVWWNNSLFKWLQSNRGSNTTSGGGPDGGGPDGAGEFSLWHNLNHKSLLPGSQTLLSFLGDPQSSRYEGMPDAAVRAALMRRLRLQHPKVAIPEPTAFFISRHGYDPLSWGAYSISHAGWDDAQHARMAQPLTACGGELRVRLAGEAMCDNLNGYTHGALQSGKESAARYLHQHGLGPDPSHDTALSLCSF